MKLSKRVNESLGDKAPPPEQRKKKGSIPLVRYYSPHLKLTDTVQVVNKDNSKESYHKFSTGTPEEVLNSRTTIETVIKSQELTTGPQ